MKTILNGQKFTLGTCYYPEHWKKEMWAEDLSRMRKVGIEVIRIAEFAWNKFEPEEGRFTFAFFDEFLELAQEKGMKVIFCTPTATPPAWMSAKYPEILNTDREGNAYRHGNRQHYTYNSAKFREFTARLVEKLGAHYASHPAIIGWQLDNEFNCSLNRFYAQGDTIAFREFLKRKYHTLDALNDAWGTVFWNQTYTDWEEVDVPRKVPSDSVNPHRMLDYYRFISDSACSYAKLQADILKKYIKADDFITTNGIFGNLDNHRLTQESLSFMMYDSYPNFAYCLDGYEAGDLLRDRKWSRNLAQVRSISPVFGIMEQQSGANGWVDRMEAPVPRPGQMTLWTLQSIAHGADFVSYFRWRTCTFGTEIYWHGILDYSGRENRRIREVADIADRLKRISEAAGAVYEAKVGILQDYDNIWDAQVDSWHARVEKKSGHALFTALQFSHVPFDYVYLPGGDLSRYEVLFCPHAAILTQERMKRLEEWVAAGGKLIMGCRTGYKDENGRCVTDCLPGLAARLTGTDIPEYSFVAPDEGRVMINWDKERAEAAVFCDQLAPAGEHARVLARYEDCYYAGTPALVANSYGRGEAYYFGAAFGPDTAELFLRKLGLAEPYKEVLRLPKEVELAVRKKGETRYLFVLNYLSEAVTIEVRKPLRELMGGEVLCGKIGMAPYEVKVFCL